MGENGAVIKSRGGEGGGREDDKSVGTQWSSRNGKARGEFGFFRWGEARQER